jgi:hypothetical protein
LVQRRIAVADAATVQPDEATKAEHRNLGASRVASARSGPSASFDFDLDKVIQGCEFDGGSANFDVLMGMDVISTGSLVVQGSNTFTFSF